MDLSIINLDILACLCLVMCLIISYVEGFKRELTKSIALTNTTLVIVLLKKLINDLINSLPINDKFTDELKVIIFIVLFFLLYCLIKWIVKKIINSISKNRIRKKTFISSVGAISLGVINSVFIVNLLVCILSIITIINSSYYSIKILNQINELLFNSTYVN